MQLVVQALEFMHHQNDRLACLGLIFAVDSYIDLRAEHIGLFLIDRLLAAGGEQQYEQQRN